ncbi:hypothetical protein XL31_005028 [Salmonella enterica subsp. enterica]|nr:hypothetical protein [Salmonella enterica subsp. enterica serovar Abony]
MLREILSPAFFRLKFVPVLLCHLYYSFISAGWRARQTRTVIRKSAVLVCLFYLKTEIMVIKNRAGK